MTNPAAVFGGFSGDPVSFGLTSVGLSGPLADPTVASVAATFYAFLNPGDSFSFDSITFSGTIPASFNGVFNTPIGSFGVAGRSD